MPPPNLIDIPADWLVQQPHLPNRCTRHGLPAVRRESFPVPSGSAMGVFHHSSLHGHPAAHRAGHELREVAVVDVSGWPLCAACLRQIAFGRALAWVLIVVGVLLNGCTLTLALVSYSVGSALIAPLVAGLGALLLAPLPLRSVSLPAVAGARATMDGAAVRLTDPHPAFVAQLPVSRRPSTAE